MDSKGDVRQFFWLVFRKPLARILLLFEAFGSGFPRPDFEMISERVQTSVYLAIYSIYSNSNSIRVSCDVGGLETCFLWIPKVTFGIFSGLCFASLWHESCCCLRLSEAVFQGQISRWFRSESRRAYLAICFLRCRRARDLLFFMDSKGGVRHFFWLVFRKPLARILLLFEAFGSGFPRPDVWGFRKRFSKARPRPDFEMISERVQTSVYLAIVNLLIYSIRVCDVGGL